jgi:hypothetical protein
VFAHRGGSALAPENSIAAFDHGLALGADGLELDVHLSRDGVVVVHHERTLDRTTALRGPIADRTADELSRAGVPGLADVLTRYRELRVIIEMKVNRAELARATIDVVRAHDAVDRVCLGAFGLGVLRAAHPSGDCDQRRPKKSAGRSIDRGSAGPCRGDAGYARLAGRTRVVSRRLSMRPMPQDRRQVWTVSTGTPRDVCSNGRRRAGHRQAGYHRSHRGRAFQANRPRPLPRDQARNHPRDKTAPTLADVTRRANAIACRRRPVAASAARRGNGVSILVSTKSQPDRRVPGARRAEPDRQLPADERRSRHRHHRSCGDRSRWRPGASVPCDRHAGQQRKKMPRARAGAEVIEFGRDFDEAREREQLQRRGYAKSSATSRC